MPVLQGVTASATTGGAQFAFSDSGTVAYLPGLGLDTNAVPIAWLDRNGKTTTLRSTAANWTGLLFSPDGSKLAMDIAESPGSSATCGFYERGRDTIVASHLRSDR